MLLSLKTGIISPISLSIDFKVVLILVNFDFLLLNSSYFLSWFVNPLSVLNEELRAFVLLKFVLFL